MFNRLPDRVSIYEVSPRDGLQNEAAPIPLGAKQRLVEALLAAGVQRLELTSFVSPRWVPQLADADELVRSVRARPGVTLSALCPNAKGFERAKAVGLDEIAVFPRTFSSPVGFTQDGRFAAARRDGAVVHFPMGALAFAETESHPEY